MSKTDRVLESLREMLSAANPGLVTKDDLARLEERLDELLELAEAVRVRLEKKREG